MVQALGFGLAGDELAIWFGILVLIVVGGRHRADRTTDRSQRVRHQLHRQNRAYCATYRGVLPFVDGISCALRWSSRFPGLALWLVRLLN